jgi:hypothetical protein
MQDHKKLVEAQVNAQDLEEARQGRQENSMHFSELLEQTQQVRLQTEESFKKLDVAEVIRRRTYLFSWLSAHDKAPDLEHCRTLRKDYPTSGQWLLRNSRFRAWFDTSSVSGPLLWVTGKPGAGMCFAVGLRSNADTTLLLQGNLCYPH